MRGGELNEEIEKASPRWRTRLRDVISKRGLERQVQGHLQEAGAADGVLDDAELSAGRADVAAVGGAVLLTGHRKWRRVLRWIGEERVEFDVVIWSVKTGMIEDIKCLHVEFQPEAFRDHKNLGNAHVYTGLERADKNVAAGGAKTSFEIIAQWNTVVCGIWGQQRNAERIDVQNGICRVDPERALQNGLGARLAADTPYGDERIGHKVVTASEENAGGAAAEVDDAVRLTAFRGNHSAGGPPVDNAVRPTMQSLPFRKLIDIAGNEDMTAVEVGIAVTGAQV